MKSIFASRVFWFNAVTAAVAFLGYLPQTPYTLYAILAANIALRFLTTTAVTLKVPGTP